MEPPRSHCYYRQQSHDREQRVNPKRDEPRGGTPKQDGQKEPPVLGARRPPTEIRILPEARLHRINNWHSNSPCSGRETARNNPWLRRKFPGYSRATRVIALVSSPV